jgi:hypothetical protein
MKIFKNSDGFAMNVSFKEASFIKYLLQAAIDEDISDTETEEGKKSYEFLKKMYEDMRDKV